MKSRFREIIAISGVLFVASAAFAMGDDDSESTGHVTVNRGPQAGAIQTEPTPAASTISGGAAAVATILEGNISLSGALVFQDTTKYGITPSLSISLTGAGTCRYAETDISEYTGTFTISNVMTPVGVTLKDEDPKSDRVTVSRHAQVTENFGGNSSSAVAAAPGVLPAPIIRVPGGIYNFSMSNTVTSSMINNIGNLRFVDFQENSF